LKATTHVNTSRLGRLSLEEPAADDFNEASMIGDHGFDILGRDRLSNNVQVGNSNNLRQSPRLTFL